jgi:hypothetical protein
MEEETSTGNVPEDAPEPIIPKPPHVYILRDWKEYAGESLLIIFSVLLALVLGEYINNLHEKKETRDLLGNIRRELINNKKLEEEQYAYHQQVLKTINFAINDAAFQKKLIADDEFHLKLLTPQGVLHRYLDDIAWDVAKNHNISSKVSIKIIALLTHIYGDQARIMKIEDEVGKVVLSREARKPENARVTLILIRDNFYAWAFDRTPGLFKQYDEAIKLLGEEE